jgi:hypothetical protein
MLDVPAKAAWLQVVVRDQLTQKIGAMEVQLPLAPEPASAAIK